MKNKKYILILLFSIIILLIGYFIFVPFLQKLETNTVSPQSSPNTESSKKHAFFVQDYKIIGLSDTLIKIKEAWVEYIWKNELVNGKVKKVKQNGLQLNLKPDSSFHNSMNFENYFIDWEMVNQYNGTIFGTSSGGVYSLYLSSSLPDTFTILVNRIFSVGNKNAETISSFKVVKK